MTGIDDEGKFTTINIYPKDSQVLNLAFDLTPAKYITNLITELGICEASEDDIYNLITK
jgi:methylthioribose-1-phosphate isomerase